MAGEFPVATPSSGRKQWKIYRGPRGPFRLGSALVEDGCPDSHVMYAKQLLEEKCDDSQDQEENERLGVYWLLKASEQGHEEATEMLHRCLQSGQGITEHNISDVKSCLDMPLDEKVSRHAAREMFASLSQGEGYITSRQLSEELLRVQDGPSGINRDAAIDQQPCGSGGVRRVRPPADSGPSEKVTEDMLVSAASRYARGLMPLVLVNSHVNVSGPSSPCDALVAVAVAPVAAVAGSCQAAVRTFASTKPSTMVSSLTGNMQALLIFAIYSIFGMDGILELLPSVLYYGSLLIMLVTTCKIISNKWEAKHFRQWSNLLVAWGGSGVNADNCEWSHCLNHATPYLVFFAALITHLAIVPNVTFLNIPHSELTVVAAFVSFFLLLNFMWQERKLDFLVIISFGVHVIARYPYEMDPVVSKEWMFLDVHVPTMVSFLIGSGVELCAKWRWWLYCSLGVVLVGMAARDRWRGIVTTLAPHLVCLAWWQVAVIAAGGATKYGLIRAGLALSGALLLLPLAGIAAMLLPVAAALRALSLGGLPLPATTALGVSFLLPALYLAIHRRAPAQGNAAESSSINWPQVAVAVCSLWILLSLGSGPVSPRGGLSWSEFRRACPSGPASARKDLSCSRLLQAQVSWHGTIVGSKVVAVHNPLAAVVTRLPQVLQDPLMCSYGEKYEDCHESGIPCLQDIPASLKDKCHLSNWNRYDYEISLTVGSESTVPRMWATTSTEEAVTLTASHRFTNTTALLVSGDHIWITGTLTGTSPPVVALSSAGCLSCASPGVPTTAPEVFDLPTIAAAAVRSLLAFLAPPHLPSAPVLCV